MHDENMRMREIRFARLDDRHAEEQARRHAEEQAKRHAEGQARRINKAKKSEIVKATKILELETDSIYSLKEKDVKKKFRSLALKHHPDKIPDKNRKNILEKTSLMQDIIRSKEYLLKLINPR